MRIWDALSFLFVVSVLGSFAFWLAGYFVFEFIRELFRGPGEQLQSLGTSILDEPPFEPQRLDFNEKIAS